MLEHTFYNNLIRASASETPRFIAGCRFLFYTRISLTNTIINTDTTYLYSWLCVPISSNITSLSDRLRYKARTSPVMLILLYSLYAPERAWLRKLGCVWFFINRLILVCSCTLVDFGNFLARLIKFFENEIFISLMPI